MQYKFDMALISSNVKIIARCEDIAKTFSYSSQKLDPTYDFQASQVEFRLVVIGGADFPNGGEFSALLTTIRHTLPGVFILYVETKNSVENSSHIAKTYGADLALNDQEFFETSKPDYIFSQVIRATYLPIKSSDILVGRAIDFDIYHLLPQREKFLKFCFTGDVVDAKKHEKLKSVDELYIHRNQADQYANYVRLSADQSEDGLNRRCRSQFLALYAGYMKLVFTITDQSEKGTYDNGVKLFTKCRDLASSLLTVLAAHPDPWAVIHTSTIGDFGSVERGPAVAAYAGIIALKMALPTVEELMIVSLISELGLLYLPRKITSHVRADTLDQLNEEEQKEYYKYPIKSIDVALDRRIQLTDKFRNISLGVHERADKKGFPKKRFGRNIPMEAFVVHFAFELDRRIAVRMGKPRIDLDGAIQTFMKEELSDPCHFTLQFLHKLKIILKSKLDPKPAKSE